VVARLQASAFVVFFLWTDLASVYTVGKRITWRITSGFGAGSAAAVAYSLVGLVPVEMPHDAHYIFGAAIIAICAMILPGISGSFMLVLMGQYQYILNAVNTRDFFTIFVFGAGAAIGLMTFARILGWIFARYHDLTIALLTGLMLGSLRKVWPWKATLETMVNRHGREVPLVQINQLPEMLTAEVTVAIGLALFGLAVVIVLEKLAERE